MTDGLARVTDRGSNALDDRRLATARLVSIWHNSCVLHLPRAPRPFRPLKTGIFFLPSMLCL
jgi:hypothetical protein